MTESLAIVPKKDNVQFLEFCDFLRNAPIRPAHGIMPSDNPRHHEILDITVAQHTHDQIFHYWQNCVDQVLLNGGQVLHGWLLWQYPDHFIAQHHTIILDKEDNLLDPTPNAASVTNILFLPDNRAPFDIENRRAPANLEWKSREQFRWVAGQVQDTDFFIAQIETTAEQSKKIDLTYQRMIERDNLLLTLREAGANILFNRLMTGFDDIETLASTQTSREFRILTQLSRVLHQTPRPPQNSQCHDWEMLIETWNELHDSFKNLSDKYEKTLGVVKHTFSVTSPAPLMLLGSIINHDTKILEKLDVGYRKDFLDFVKAANLIVCDFRINLLRYNSVDIMDNFFSQTHLFDQKNVDFEAINIKETTVYLDTNAVSNLLKKPKNRVLCLQKQKDRTVSFVYSSYLIADAVNMNPFFLKEYIDNLSKLTENRMIGIIDSEPCFVREDIKNTLDRAETYKKATASFEENRFIKVLEHYHEHPELRKGRSLANALTKGPVDFFTNNEKYDTPGFELVQKKFYRNDFISEFIETGTLRKFEQSEVRNVVDALLELLDFTNFETEAVKFSNRKKIASSYRDNEHITHASIADYFVTDDEKVKIRGNLIYSIIGARTKVMGVKDFLEKLETLQ